MTNITTGEALPSILTLMKQHNERTAELDNHSTGESVDELDRHLQDAIHALLNPTLECSNAHDAVAVLKYVQDTFMGKDSVFDALLPLVRAWAEKLTEAAPGRPTAILSCSGDYPFKRLELRG